MGSAVLVNTRKCGCVEQYKGLWCPACHGTGMIPPPPKKQSLKEILEEINTHAITPEARRQLTGLVIRAMQIAATACADQCDSLFHDERRRTADTMYEQGWQEAATVAENWCREYFKRLTEFQGRAK